MSATDYVTHRELKEELKKQKKEIVSEVSEFIEKQNTVFSERFDEIRKLILVSESKTLGELKTMREEFGAHQSSHRRIDDELQNHFKRLHKIESATI